MSTTESINVSHSKEASWRKSDTTWTLGLFRYSDWCRGFILPNSRRLRRPDPNIINAVIGLPHCLLLPPRAGAPVSFGI